MRKLFMLLAAVLFTGSIALAGSTTSFCHFNYSNSEPLNATIDKLDAAMRALFSDCSALTPKFPVTTTTTSTTTSTSSSTSTSTSSTTSTT